MTIQTKYHLLGSLFGQWSFRTSFFQFFVITDVQLVARDEQILHFPLPVSRPVYLTCFEHRVNIPLLVLWRPG